MNQDTSSMPKNVISLHVLMLFAHVETKKDDIENVPDTKLNLKDKGNQEHKPWVALLNVSDLHNEPNFANIDIFDESPLKKPNNNHYDAQDKLKTVDLAERIDNEMIKDEPGSLKEEVLVTSTLLSIAPSSASGSFSRYPESLGVRNTRFVG